jgi:hypothetical protein
VWGRQCKFCKNTTPTTTGRCAVCLAPLDADPANFAWSPPAESLAHQRVPGPHGDKGAVKRAGMRWRGNKGILAREGLVFFLEVLIIGLFFHDLIFTLAFPPAGSPGQVLPFFVLALFLGIARPSMHRALARVADPGAGAAPTP